MNGKRPALSVLTRRHAVAALLITPAIAQTTVPPPSTVPPQGVPAPPSAAASAQDRQHKAEADIQKASVALQKVPVPMDLEPAFAFSPLT